MRSITIPIKINEDPIFKKNPNDCLIVLCKSKNRVYVESRIYGSGVCVPRIPF